MEKPIDKFEIEPGVMVKIYSEFDPDWSWVDDDATKRKIRRGDVEQVIVVISIFDKSGEVEGTDSLGGIVVGLDDHKQEIRDTIDAHGMIDEARANLKQKLNRIFELNK